MKTSSFFLGIVLGAVASSMISRNRNMLGLSMDIGGKKGGNLVQQARTKMMDAAFPGMGEITLNKEDTHKDQDHHSQTDKTAYNAHTAKNKEENMKLIKDFISTSPDVKREVEQILKETHTAVPGL
ncbi:hypothetical protein ACYCS5_00690 [Paenibacillus sp. SEL3]|uniref:Uncharacterized protein n=1 Tax=Paenibacillus polymyxa TaxID=1406 RepID=A0A8I1IY83_PAEPO|nr:MULTISPECIES: hypothetical protein [Paenibacillus]KAF6636740.1 hypothetical protein H6F38_05770 [Paenibacillus sp. EKM208P]KAF6575166.1 hypothetical protein G9G53_09015 [Paenibacillus sp. EKM206P]KAF6590161.1 hypothetical protein G9G52_05315 [Paenibacillus sp. EKM205P]MBM0632490.1 hypothetical protein [Paenibacillus polymyxa]MBO3286716.1 hypothetical protein [Paenibacillus polymyxa]